MSAGESPQSEASELLDYVADCTADNLNGASPAWPTMLATAALRAVRRKLKRHISPAGLALLNQAILEGEGIEEQSRRTAARAAENSPCPRIVSR